MMHFREYMRRIVVVKDNAKNAKDAPYAAGWSVSNIATKGLLSLSMAPLLLAPLLRE